MTGEILAVTEHLVLRRMTNDDAAARRRTEATRSSEALTAELAAAFAEGLQCALMPPSRAGKAWPFSVVPLTEGQRDLPVGEQKTFSLGGQLISRSTHFDLLASARRGEALLGDDDVRVVQEPGRLCAVIEGSVASFAEVIGPTRRGGSRGPARHEVASPAVGIMLPIRRPGQAAIHLCAARVPLLGAHCLLSRSLQEEPCDA